MAFTLATIQTRLENRLKDIADIGDILFQNATDLNQSLYKIMFELDVERFVTTSTYTVSSSPSTQALPVNFRDVSEAGLGFFIQNTDGTASTNELRYTGYGSADVGYYITGTNIVFTGISTAKTIILRYVPVLADITSLDQFFVVPDENKELVLEGMVLHYYRNQEDPRESDQDMRFARAVEDFKDGLRKTPSVFTLPSKLGGRSISHNIPRY